MLHKLECPHCQDGRIIKSTYGGNDPDTWDAGACPAEDCDRGTVTVDDNGIIGKLALSAPGGPVALYGGSYQHSFDWMAQDASRGPGAPVLIGYGDSQAAAVRELIDALEMEADDAAYDARCAEAARSQGIAA